MDRCLEENEIVDLVTGMLEPEEARAADAHIDQCAACRLVLIELARVFELKASNVSDAAVLEESKSSDGSDTGPSLTLAIPEMARGTAIGRYVVLEFLGAGAMGVVFSAYDPELDRKVALKLIRMGTRAKNARDRLVREARSVAQMAHPNVVVVHDVGEHDDASVFMAMEFVDGGTLGEWLEAHPRTHPAILQAFVAAGRGLEAAHAAGIVHRDFKPMNVLMGSDERPRVTDFGLAFGDLERSSEVDFISSDDPGDATLTRTGMLVGTPAYMAPEQFERSSVDARSDQFSFCVALYEALCGERPFAGRTVSELAANVVAGRLAEPEQLEALPRYVRVVLERGLRADASERYPDMSALLTALTPEVSDRGSRWMLASGAALGVAGFAYGVWATPADADTGCDDGLQRIEAMWNEERRERLGSALTREIESTFESTNVNRALTAIDHRVDAWAESHATVCAAGASAEQLRCLEGVRTRLAAVIEALEVRGGAALFDAAPTALRIPPAAQCETDPGFLGDPLSASSDGPNAEGWKAYRLASKLYDLGAYPEAITEASRARTVAEEHDDVDLLPRASLVVGRSEVELGRLDDAERSFESAFMAAWAAHDTPVGLSSLARLVTLVGSSKGDQERAQLWLDIGVAATARVDGPSIEEAMFWEAAGVLAQSRNDWDTATEHHERALEMRSALLTPGHPDIISSLHHLSGIDYEIGNVARGLERSREVLRHRIETLGEEHPNVVFARSALAIGLIYAGEVDEAIEQLEAALEVGTRVLGEFNPVLGAPRTNLASALNRKGEHAKALKIYRDVLETWETARGKDHVSVGLAHNNLGSTARKLGDLDAARHHYEQAIAIWEAQLGPDHARLAAGLSGLAVVLVDQGSCEEARPLAERAEGIMAPLDANPRSVKTHYARSRIELCLGEFEAAQDAADTALAHGEAVFGADNPSLGLVLVQVARAHLKTGDREGSRRAASRAVELAKSDTDRAQGTFLLAQTESDPQRGLALAKSARDMLPEGAGHDAFRTELDAFLRADAR